ncbi:Uncharacterized protein T310_5012 [Rasamsonia emersonii CBS 393.64]|uniref:DUF221 domain protein n=1 Tax=Rasamsonia emersonii (strain ATCC 16479 / CBS 393.64 / IMI 116815) TaxID=1408163 RepID=A0A0F4YTK1_RASE3|nr:Uncharacterized protein T310_5012 [Rasamsonia emersonii CBS 393.64]KKA20958.1 Uncharacterized protein T310_5012 [Rasamsonia emersonii CBS 393.64]
MSATAIAATAVFDVAPAMATHDGPNEPRWEDQARRGQRDLYTQFVISVILGLSAFLAFCTLRPKWTELYAARRKRRNAASALPELPDSFFGWIPVLYRITDEEVLASAGLDAYVFLSFFKFALKFLSATFVFAVGIILPLHLRYAGQSGIPGWDQDDGDNDDDMELYRRSFLFGSGNKELKSDPNYLWMYVIFTYVFTGLAVYLLIQETNKIILTRQKYLGSQTSTTDRTIRLSGIPPELRSEEKIKGFIEGLQIGKVESITLCRNWQELDMLMEERMKILRNLERSWTKHLGYKKRKRDSNTLPLIRSRRRSTSVTSDITERSHLLENEDGRPLVSNQARARPQTRIWYGPFKLWFRNVDAIDYYTEKLRRLDEKIMAARQKEYPPTALAFVTMESISASQMVVQAILDPHPMQLVATLAPAPADVLYAYPFHLSLPMEQTNFDGLGLSGLQGMTSRGDVELSIISKNFFFTFFNLFLVFTVFGSATTFYGFWENLRDKFKDATTIAFALATSLEKFSQFYINWIILHGLGLFPFRLLEFGSVAMYPIHFLSAKTPREYAELSTPPTFSYGFSIPQTILIFIICVVYSVFPSSWLICLCGLVYFFLGQFIYKYQLLYAMDHQQHSTGRAWPMICSRVFVGLVVFQLAMIGVLALRRAITRSLLLVPLLGATVWFTYFFARTYEPLTKFIALRSIDKDRPDESEASLSPPAVLSPPSGLDRDSLPLRIGGRDIGLRLKKYVNPSLIMPLDGPWIPGRDRPVMISPDQFEEGQIDGAV